MSSKVSYKRHDWFDQKANVARFGIEAKAVGFESRWLHCAEDGKPLIFDSEADRDAKLKELRRKTPAKPEPLYCATVEEASRAGWVGAYVGNHGRIYAMKRGNHRVFRATKLENAQVNSERSESVPPSC